MSEIILDIQEILDDKNNDGFYVITNKQTVSIKITNNQQCCESWGYFVTNDNPEYYIGAELYDIKIVDEILNKEKLVNIYDGSICFVDFETSKGILQITLYNEHNGYYSHYACVESKQLSFDSWL